MQAHKNTPSKNISSPLWAVQVHVCKCANVQLFQHVFFSLFRIAKNEMSKLVFKTTILST